MTLTIKPTTPDITVRAYRPEDSVHIAELFYNTVHSVNAVDYSEAQLEAWASKDKDSRWWQSRLKKLHTVVAEKAGVIVGFGGMDSTGYFDLLYVGKDHQRMGIATLIANSLEGYIFARGINAITTDASITARPFFEKRGYLVLEKQTVETNGQQLVNFKMKKLEE
jgi:putative acetyltransferase